MLRMVRTLPKLLVFSQLLLVTSFAHAEDPAAAEALFQEGRRLLSEGKVTAACEKLKDSFALDPMSGTLLNLADCYEKDGRMATAWARFRNAANLAKSQGKTEQVAEANRRIKALESELSYLKIEVPEPVPGLEVYRNDAEVTSASFGVEVPIDPGKVTVVASAPGYKTIRLKLEVRPHHDKQSITVPKLSLSSKGGSEEAPDMGAGGPADDAAETKPESGPKPEAAKPAPVAPSPPPEAKSAPSPEPPPSGNPGPSVMTWVAGGTGAALLLTGSIFGYLAMQSNTDAANLCPSKHGCSKAAMAVVERRDQQAMVANIGVSLGLAGVATAVVLYLVTKPHSERGQSASLTLSPGIGRDMAGLWATGGF